VISVLSAALRITHVLKHNDSSESGFTNTITPPDSSRNMFVCSSAGELAPDLWLRTHTHRIDSHSKMSNGQKRVVEKASDALVD